MNILSETDTSGLRKHKILRMASEALDQDGLLTQEDLAVLLCSSKRTIRRDIKELKEQGMTWSLSCLQAQPAPQPGAFRSSAPPDNGPEKLASAGGPW